MAASAVHRVENFAFMMVLSSLSHTPLSVGLRRPLSDRSSARLGFAQRFAQSRDLKPEVPFQYDDARPHSAHELPSSDVRAVSLQ